MCGASVFQDQKTKLKKKANQKNHNPKKPSNQKAQYGRRKQLKKKTNKEPKNQDWKKSL